jgi:predicted oxidoreductase
VLGHIATCDQTNDALDLHVISSSWQGLLLFHQANTIVVAINDEEVHDVFKRLHNNGHLRFWKVANSSTQTVTQDNSFADGRHSELAP